MTSSQLGDATHMVGMHHAALVAIAKLTGEPCRPCRFKGTTYAVSKSWLVWYAKDDWHSVYRGACLHMRAPSLQDALPAVAISSAVVPWQNYRVDRLDLEALRQHVKTCGYTMVDVALRLGYVPTNKRVAKYLAGKLPVTQEFAQRAVAAFGRGVLRGES